MTKPNCLCMRKISKIKKVKKIFFISSIRALGTPKSAENFFHRKKHARTD